MNKKFYIVESGKYIALKTEKSGHDKIVSQFKEGDVFGEMCLVSKKSANESIMSLVLIIVCRQMEKYMALKETASKGC